MKRRIVLIAVAVAASSIWAPLLWAKPAMGGSQLEILVVTTGNESDAEAIANMSAKDPQYRTDAMALIEGWKSSIASGDSLDLRGLTSPLTAQRQLDQLSALSSRISTQFASVSHTAVTQPPGSATPVESAGTSLIASDTVAVAAVDGGDPNSFAVRGVVGSGRTSWTKIGLIVAAHFCNLQGCQADTDRFSCTVTVNPGAVTSKIGSPLCLYSPNAGNFGNKHYQLWAINRGSVVGSANTGDVSGSGTYYVSSTGSLRGTVLTVAITLWVFLNPFGSYTADGTKTPDATCHTTDNVCVY